MDQPLAPQATEIAPPAGHAFLVDAWEILQAGGPVVAILILMSVVALAIVILKLVQFRVARIGDRRFVADALMHYRNGKFSAALQMLGLSRNPVARAMEVAIRGRATRNLDDAIVREEVQRVATDSLNSLRSYLRGLEVIATLSPLLGLLGTVLGMIEVFQAMETAGSQTTPSILAGGIWEALLTTAVGLGVAIPVVALTNWLESAVDGLAADMESAVTQIFTYTFATPEDKVESRDFATNRLAR